MTPGCYFPSNASLVLRRDPTFLAKLSDVERLVLPYYYDFWLRHDQQFPVGFGGKWFARIAGRGNGKTFANVVEYIRRVQRGQATCTALIGPTEDRVKQILVREIVHWSPPWFKAKAVNGGIVWPNGSRAYVYSAESQEVRGMSFDFALATEIGQWSPNTRMAAWESLDTAVRMPGGRNQILIDTTSKGRNDVIAKILDTAESNPDVCRIARGTIFDNEWFPLQQLRAELLKYPPGRKRDEELFGKVFTESSEALWREEWLEAHRRDIAPADCDITLVSVDPATTSGKYSDECGFVVGSRKGNDIYVTADRSRKFTNPTDWANLCVDYYEAGAAGVVVEVTGNSGGDMIGALLRMAAKERGYLIEPCPDNGRPMPPRNTKRIYLRERKVRDGKADRASPAAALTEQGRVHLVGNFPQLEAELVEWSPGVGKSPNRLDAFAQLVHELSGVLRDTKPDGGTLTVGLGAPNGAGLVSTIRQSQALGRRGRLIG